MSSGAGDAWGQGRAGQDSGRRRADLELADPADRRVGLAGRRAGGGAGGAATAGEDVALGGPGLRVRGAHARASESCEGSPRPPRPGRHQRFVSTPEPPLVSWVLAPAVCFCGKIVEINLGAVTRELWAKQPQLRERVGREWTHAHYQNHRRDRGQRFLEEKIQVLEKLMVAGGHTHLILAGNAKLTAQIRERLPPHLGSRLIDTVQFSALASPKDVVDMTLWSFIEAEQRESHDAVTELVSALSRQGLAVAGTQPSLEAIQRGQADVLLLSSPYRSEPVWRCSQCARMETRPVPPASCEACGSTASTVEDSKQLLVRLAEQRGVEIELVHASDALMRIGGVGCLLRYASDWEWCPADGEPLGSAEGDESRGVRHEPEA